MEETSKRGVEVLKDQRLSKSTAFTNEEKEKLGLRGLLPYAISTQDIQKQRIIENIRRKHNDLEKYIFLTGLLDRNERLFYRVMMDYLPELVPIIYTPTVGDACLQFSHIYRVDRGFYITPEDRGSIEEILDDWPHKDIRIIVVTDGSRILGLGDLGCNGMPIPIGKLSLYSAGGGIDPKHCLPIMLDMGTDNEEFLSDPMYLGYPHKRLRGQEYDDIIEEFVTAVRNKYPKVLIQFEDFVTPNAVKILRKYRKQVLCFNDDIQGTASVALAGTLMALKITGGKLEDQNILFLGAGSASTGIAHLMIKAFMEKGLSEEESLKKMSFVDIHGLVTKDREELDDHLKILAADDKPASFMEAIKLKKPTILIGASGAAGAFTQEVVEAMCEINERPIIFALSNPTAHAECTAEQAYTWSKGKAVFASGSPFDPVEYEGQTFIPGQANNVYIFPGIGLAAMAVEAKYLPDSAFLVAAESLAKEINPSDLEAGTVFPKLVNLRTISFEIAVDVANHLYELGLAETEQPVNLRAYIKSMMYDPTY